MNPVTPLLLSLGLLAAAAVPAAPAADPPAPAGTGNLAASESPVTLPGIVVRSGAHQSLELAGQVALHSGILEFLAVQPGGREYESLLTLKTRPSVLQAALLLIGCEPGPLPARAKNKQKPGDRLTLEIEWQSGGRTRRLPAQQLLLDRKTQKPPTNVTWIFTGSEFVKGIDGREIFQADAEQAFIALWDTSSIPINLAGQFGNPYQGDDQGLEVNTAAAPPKDTPIKLLIRKYGE